MIGVCFTNKCYIVTFHTRHSFQTHVSIKQAILLHMYSIITTMKCCIALCLIINSLSSLLKGFHIFPKERIPPEGITCDSKYLKYTTGSPKRIPRFLKEIFCSPKGIHTCVSKDNICSPKGIPRFPKKIFCSPKGIHTCVSKDKICSPKGIHRFPKEIFRSPKGITWPWKGFMNWQILYMEHFALLCCTNGAAKYRNGSDP